jgi:uncharacterized membrane protein
MSVRTIQILTAASLLCIASTALADTYIPIDFPGAAFTEVDGINASGVMVGSYTDSSGSTHGFKLDRGTFTALDFPGALTTFAFSVNSRGDITGAFLDAANQYHGYVLSHGDYFVQDYPGATTGTFTFDISANGTLVGEFKVGQAFGQLGFAWMMRHGEYTQLMPPDCNGDAPARPVQAFATSINPSGDVVGRLIDAALRQCAWKREQDGTYSIIQFSGATLTNARGINPEDEIVGVYRLGVNHGFLLPAGDFTNFTTLDFPGASATRALGINARGDIVGSYALVGPQGGDHGFLLIRDGDGRE